jgi:hypothetical protein
MTNATRTSWKTQPLPLERETFDLLLLFSDADLERLRRGHIPSDMDDKWFMDTSTRSRLASSFLIRSQVAMSRVGPDHLRKLALEAVEEAAAASHLGPVPRTRGLALALAWLLHYGKEGETLPRWPFMAFWRELAAERQHDRWSAVNAATNAIYLALGEQRSRELEPAFEQAAREPRTEHDSERVRTGPTRR